MDSHWIEDRIEELWRLRRKALTPSGRHQVDVKLAFRIRQWRRAVGCLYVIGGIDA